MNNPSITYDEDDQTIIVDHYPEDLVLICYGVYLEDSEVIIIEGDYYTPDDYIGGKTAQEKAEDYYYKYPEKFEPC